MNEPQVIKNTDDYLTVDINKKIINIPDTEKLMGVTNEVNAERKYFMMPLMLGNNLSVKDMEIRIIYKDINEIDDAYFVTDKKVDLENETVTFSWEIGRNVTQNKGEIQFALCLIKTDSSGMITNEWHTQFAKAEVKEGPSCAFLNEIPLEQVEDLVAKLLKKMQAEADTQIKRIQEAGTIAGGGLTKEQINALAGMFNVCAYDAGSGSDPDPGKLQAIKLTKENFDKAFGISGEVEPPEPPIPHTPEKNIEQVGNKLVIKKGVTVTRQVDKLVLA